MTLNDGNLVETLDAAQATMGERLGGFTPEVGLILGSGLGPLADRIEDPSFVPFGEVPGMGVSTASGHVGRFVAGMLGGKRVLAMQGRLHGYEGYTAQEVAFPIPGISPLNLLLPLTFSSLLTAYLAFSCFNQCFLSSLL